MSKSRKRREHELLESLTIEGSIHRLRDLERPCRELLKERNVRVRYFGQRRRPVVALKFDRSPTDEERRRAKRLVPSLRGVFFREVWDKLRRLGVEAVGKIRQSSPFPGMRYPFFEDADGTPLNVHKQADPAVAAAGAILEDLVIVRANMAADR